MKVLHIATHRGWQESSKGGSGINSGDTCLNEVIQSYFKNEFRGIEIHSRQIWERVKKSDVLTWNKEYDYIMIGGGGQLLNDQPGLDEKLSGWTWQIAYDDLICLKVPFIFYSVGYNKFPFGAEFSDLLWKSLHYIYLNSVFFSMRNSGSIEKVRENFAKRGLEMTKEILFQPCLTTIYAKLFQKEFKHELSDTATIAVNIAVDRISSRISYSQEDFYKNCQNMIIGLYASDKVKKVDLICHKEIDGLNSEDIDNINSSLKPHQQSCSSVDLTNLDSEQIYEVYSTYDLTVGMRGHGIMIPTGCGKPTFSLVSHPKLKYLLEDLNMIHLPIYDDISEEFNSSHVVNKILKSLEMYDQITEDLEQALEYLHEITMKNTLRLKTFLES